MKEGKGGGGERKAHIVTMEHTHALFCTLRFSSTISSLSAGDTTGGISGGTLGGTLGGILGGTLGGIFGGTLGGISGGITGGTCWDADAGSAILGSEATSPAGCAKVWTRPAPVLW